MKLQKQSNRILIEVPLVSALGPTFQPTGFPDLGASRYVAPGTNKENLLVESTQSVANRLEETIWDKDLKKPIFEGLPYVRLVNHEGKFLSSSLHLPHRLASAYITKYKQSNFKDQLVQAIEENGSAAATFRFCPNSLLHGVFYSHIGDGKHKLQRLVGGSIDAYDVTPVVVGGAVKDPISPAANFDLKDFGDSKRGSESGLGNILSYAEQYAAKKIVASFSIDTLLINALPIKQDCAKELLKAIAFWKIYRFLQFGLRLRSNCLLEVAGEPVVTGGCVPDLDVLEEQIPQLIADCQRENLFAAPVVTEISLILKPKNNKEQDKTPEANPEQLSIADV